MRNRGFGMLGLMGMIVLVGTLCAAVTVSSMRSARGSIAGIQRLKIQAAAEGAGVLLASGDMQSSESLVIGDCRVTARSEPGAAADAGSSETLFLLKTDLLVSERVALTRNYRARIRSGALSVEALP